MDTQQIILAIVVPVMIVCVSSFVSIVLWLYARHRERAAFYRSEAMKRVADGAGAGGTVVLEIMREEERASRRTRREGQKLGGLIAIAIGIGLIVFMKGVSHDRSYFLGLIPLLVGVAVLSFGLLSRDQA